MEKFLEIFATSLPDVFEIPLWVWIALFIIAGAVLVWVLKNDHELIYKAYNAKEVELMTLICQFDAARRTGNHASRQTLCSEKHSYLITETIGTENETSSVRIRLIVDWHTDDGNIPGISDTVVYSNKCLDYLRESERIGYAEDVLRRTVINKLIADFNDRRYSYIMNMSRESLAKHIKWVMGNATSRNGIIIDGIEVLDVKDGLEYVKEELTEK